MKKAYVVPHPPIILPEVGRGEEERISETIEAYRRVADEILKIKPDTIIISSPHAPYYRNSFYLADAERALGDLFNFGVLDVEEEVKLDRKLALEIKKVGRDLPINFTKEDAENLDHGCLVPLRFIKEVYSDFKVVRLGLSTLSGRDHYKLGMAIEKAAKNLGRNYVYIASGDLSHVLKEDGPYGYRDEGPKFDKKIIDILERAAFDELIKFSEYEAECAAQCGLHSFQIMAGTFDGQDVKAEKYSYEGPFGVGYAVISFTAGDENKDRHFLVRKETDPYIELARRSIESYVKFKKIIEPTDDLPQDMLNNRAGAFVSIHLDKELRGCIGTIGPVRENIAEEIIGNAISASTEDPRFPPVSKGELKNLEISVDILEKAEPISKIDELDPKTYGVIVSKDFRRGLLLPNLEGVDTAEEQVKIARRKAGIGPLEDFKMERFKVVRHEYK